MIPIEFQRASTSEATRIVFQINSNSLFSVSLSTGVTVSVMGKIFQRFMRSLRRRLRRSFSCLDPWPDGDSDIPDRIRSEASERNREI